MKQAVHFDYTVHSVMKSVEVGSATGFFHLVCWINLAPEFPNVLTYALSFNTFST